jgi:hypothetical protein
LKKTIRAVFENKVGSYLIPNGMSEHLTNEMIEYIRKHDTNESPFQKFRDVHPNSYLPYDSHCDNEVRLESDILSELEIDDNYITTDAVIYLYFIGTAGAIESGLNPTQNNPPVETSYFENLSDIVIHYLQTKDNFFLYFRNQQEGIDEDIIDLIYHQSNKHNIPLEKIVLQADSCDYELMKKNIENKYKINYNIKYFMYPWALTLGAEYIKELTDLNNIVKDFKTNRTHKVICLNRRLKKYRIGIISFLLGMKYENMYLSYDTDWGNEKELIYDNPYKKEVKDILNEGYSKLLETKKRKADNIDDDFDKVYFDDCKMYENSYFSIVTESHFFNSLRITEKVTKPILNYHPFVILGNQHTLKVLKFYGFKTFSDFWDESYDEIEDSEERFLATTEVVNYLMNLSTKEWDDLTKKLKPILIYNKENLKKFSITNIKEEYEDNLINLLENQYSNKYNSIICSE